MVSGVIPSAEHSRRAVLVDCSSRIVRTSAPNGGASSHTQDDPRTGRPGTPFSHQPSPYTSKRTVSTPGLAPPSAKSDRWTARRLSSEVLVSGILLSAGHRRRPPSVNKMHWPRALVHSLLSCGLRVTPIMYRSVRRDRSCTKLPPDNPNMTAVVTLRALAHRSVLSTPILLFHPSSRTIFTVGTRRATVERIHESSGSWLVVKKQPAARRVRPGRKTDFSL
jgi:hypothetical protein